MGIFAVSVGSRGRVDGGWKGGGVVWRASELGAGIGGDGMGWDGMLMMMLMMMMVVVVVVGRGHEDAAG